MITVTLFGRLGNQMFEHAIARTVAERLGYNFYINADEWLGHELFNCDLGVWDGSPKYDFKDKDNQPYNPEVYSVKDFTRFYGYFQSHKYFDREDVKKWFVPNYTQEAKDLMVQYPRDEYCYINIRGGDQKTPQLTLPREYYDAALGIMLSKHHGLKLVVVTDDVDLSKWYFPNLPVHSNSKETDFCLLHSAKYVISAISTFCWWACYLQDDNYVLAPKGWFLYNINRNEFAPKDIDTPKFNWI